MSNKDIKQHIKETNANGKAKEPGTVTQKSKENVKPQPNTSADEASDDIMNDILDKADLKDKVQNKDNEVKSSSLHLAGMLNEKLDTSIDTENDTSKNKPESLAEKKDKEETTMDQNKAKTSDELLDQIIDEEMDKMIKSGDGEKKTGKDDKTAKKDDKKDLKEDKKDGEDDKKDIKEDKEDIKDDKKDVEDDKKDLKADKKDVEDDKKDQKDDKKDVEDDNKDLKDDIMKAVDEDKKDVKDDKKDVKDNKKDVKDEKKDVKDDKKAVEDGKKDLKNDNKDGEDDKKDVDDDKKDVKDDEKEGEDAKKDVKDDKKKVREDKKDVKDDKQDVKDDKKAEEDDKKDVGDDKKDVKDDKKDIKDDKKDGEGNEKAVDADKKEAENSKEDVQDDKKAEEDDKKVVEGDKKGVESARDSNYPKSYSIQDDVRFLKFVSNLNEQVCSCNRAGNDFVLDDFGSNCHMRGCPSSLSPKDLESVKVLFLTRHLPKCKRFLTQSERQVLKNILKTAPYYQIEFFNQNVPYEIQSEGQDLVKSHMVDERSFPKREDQKDIPKTKKAILDSVRELVKPAPPVTDPNLNRFPVEEYKFGDKYAEKPKKKPIDINDHPYDYPKTSDNGPNSTNADIMDERLILNLLNDIEAWTCFTAICICDVITPQDDERNGCASSETTMDDNTLKAKLLEGLPDEEKKALSPKIDKHLQELDDLVKARLREKIEREREYMQILLDGKLKKEELFVDILAYKNNKRKKDKQEISLLVNDMFKELIRNNKDIGKDMDNKLNRENVFMERDIRNKMKLKMLKDLKLSKSKAELLERHIEEVLADKFEQEHELIKSELEYELERCDAKSLRLFQEVLNQVNKDRNHEYDNINEHFRAMTADMEKRPSSSELGRVQDDDFEQNRQKSPEPPQKESPRKPDEEPSRDKERTADNVRYDNVDDVAKPSPTREPTNKTYADPDKTIDNRDSRHTQTSPAKRKPTTLGEEIDKMMEDLWKESKDKEQLIRELINEMRRYDLNEQSPKDKAVSTKKSYKDFKDDMDSKLAPLPERKSTAPRMPNRPVDRSVARRPDEPKDGENILTLFDAEFRYFIVELPMTDHKIELYHDSFYGRKKTLAEIGVTSDSRQIRTDIDMKN